MSKRTMLLLVIAGMAMIFAATSLQAGTTVEDTFKVITKEYKKRKKEAATLSHKKHAEDYGITCGECHHDKDGKPLTDLKMGDDVQRCVECHTKLKKDPKNKKDIMVLENAMHGNCIDCHKEVNKKAGDPKGRKGPAPASCAKCHPKKKK
ncbi:MAG: cytochrome C [Desulfobacteraceae bacterium]|nr:MAG: cytochrome C [Desulfobacteraceae bacterium]